MYVFGFRGWVDAWVSLPSSGTREGRASAKLSPAPNLPSKGLQWVPMM